MGNRWLLVLLALYGAPSFGQTFPEGCVVDNMEKVCQTLSEIKPTAQIQFADGTLVPGCIIQTENLSALKEDSQNKDLDLLTRKYFELIQKDASLTDQQLAKMLRYPGNLHKYFSEHNIATDKEEWTKYNSLVESRSARDYVWTEKKNFEPIYSFTNSQINALADFTLNSDAVADKSTFKKLKKLNIYQPPTPGQISCRPSLNAAYEEGTIPGAKAGAVLLSEGMGQMNEGYLYFVVGHELGHSFDPCHSKVKNVSEKHPFRKLISCLRDDIGQFKKRASPKTNDEWCQDNHTCEAFSDYFGAYVLEQKILADKSRMRSRPVRKVPEAITAPPGYEHIFGMIDSACAEGLNTDDTNDSHPSWNRRLKEIILRNPAIAKSVGCDVPSNTPRCDIEKGLVNSVKPSNVPTAETNSAVK